MKFSYTINRRRQNFAIPSIDEDKNLHSNTYNHYNDS